MSVFTYVSFFVSPLILILVIFYLRFKFSIQSFNNIRNAILFGMIGVILLVIATYLIELQWNDNLRNMRRMSFFVFIIVAFSSELAKFLALKFAFSSLKSFEGPLEGILYGVFISLGFSTIATILFAYGIVGTETKFNDMTLYLYTYPLASFAFGVVLGFFTGMGKLRKNGFIDNSTGLFVATFFHGLFYFCFITSDKRLLIFTAIGFFIISIALIIKAVNLRVEKA